MFRLSLNKKGVVLYMVLATVLIVTILANVVLNIILSQSRFTHHQVSRIRAYYAAQAGMNLALEQLRTGTWSTSGSHAICPASGTGCSLVDSDIPYRVDITIIPYGSSGCNGSQVPSGIKACVNAITNYTPTP